MEYRDLYDINRTLTGKSIKKGDLIPKNNYILVVLIFIQNAMGDFLIQKRSEKKNGKYASTGGHPKSGESSVQGIITEVQEELGLVISPDELKLIYSGRQDETQVFFDVYYMKKDLDISTLSIQEDEVAFVEWASIERIKELAAKDLFFKNHYEEFERLFDAFRENSIV